MTNKHEALAIKTAELISTLVGKLFSLEEEINQLKQRVEDLEGGRPRRGIT